MGCSCRPTTSRSRCRRRRNARIRTRGRTATLKPRLSDWKTKLNEREDGSTVTGRRSQRQRRRLDKQGERLAQAYRAARGARDTGQGAGVARVPTTVAPPLARRLLAIASQDRHGSVFAALGQPGALRACCRPARSPRRTPPGPRRSGRAGAAGRPASRARRGSREVEAARRGPAPPRARRARRPRRPGSARRSASGEHGIQLVVELHHLRPVGRRRVGRVGVHGVDRRRSW